MYYAYIVRCADGTYYSGYAADLAARVRTHNLGAVQSIPAPASLWRSSIPNALMEKARRCAVNALLSV